MELEEESQQLLRGLLLTRCQSRTRKLCPPKCSLSSPEPVVMLPDTTFAKFIIFAKPFDIQAVCEPGNKVQSTATLYSI